MPGIEVNVDSKTHGVGGELLTDDKHGISMLIAQKFSLAKTRVLINVGWDAQEEKWLPADNIRQALIIPSWMAGATTTTAQELLVCFDASAVAAVSLIGADGAANQIASGSANLNSHVVLVGQALLVTFNSALSYDANVGFLGNVWVRSINDVHKLKVTIHGAS